jgi:hypothetical protein
MDKYILFFISSGPDLKPTQPPIQCVTGVLFPGVKWPGRETDHSTATNAEVRKNMDLSFQSPIPCTEFLVVQHQFLYVSQLAEYIDNISCQQMTERNIKIFKLWALVSYMIHCHACYEKVRRNVDIFHKLRARHIYKIFVLHIDSMEINMLQILTDNKHEGND